MGDSVQIPPGSNGVWRVHVKGFEGVILYPALVTPAIVEAGGCLTVIVAVKDDFKNNYNLPSPGKEIEKNALVAQALHAQICLVEWGDAAIFDTSDIQVMIGHYRNIIAQRHMLYSSHSAAIDKYNNKDKNPKGAPYRCWYLGELQETDFPVEGFDGDGNPRKWGVIHRAAAAMHRKAGAGYKHLIQVNFKEFDNAKIAGMYELAYVYFKLYNDETDLALITEDAGTKPPMRPGGVGSVDTVEVAKTEPPQPPMRYSHIDLGYTDPDDDMLTGYFAQPEDLKKRPKLLQEPEIIQVPKITGDRRRFRLYDSARLEEDGQASDADDKGKEYQLAYTSNADGPYLQARHPVCIVDPEKWQGRIGVMGDLHVSSRQALFPLVNAQVIPGADEKDSPYIGKIAHRSLESVESLLQEIGKDSDLLVLAGDLYDHTRNCDPWHYVTNQKEVLADKTKTVKAKMSMSNTGQLWQAMDYRGYENDYDAYPRGIDGLLLFSRILSVYQSGKPVIYISGNHEGYERPFGISPRIVVDNDTFMRTNAGIPSDHNLTIYEAALLYGQASYDLGTNLKDFQLNFKGENLDWLYCLYTPWKDFILSYTVKNKEEAAPVIGKAKPNTDTLYNFVCLGWGNQEDFLKSAASGGGTLPRAPASCDDSQMKLVKWATDSSAKYNILLSHFTFVCYDRDKPFDDKKAVISTGIEKPKLAAFATPVTAALETGRYAFTATSTQPYLPVKKSHYDIGSFYQNRPAMYELLKDALVSYENLPTIARSGKIHYVLSGHAHRAGAYTFTRLGYDFAAKAWLYKDPDKPEPSLDLRALGRDVVNARCLVCGAAGPYSYRNLKGELGGFGMARPQGMVLDVPGDRVEWKETGGQLPRLAVIMENLWYIGDCPPFEMIRVDPASKQFYFRLNKDFKKIFNGGHPFEAITLVGIWSADSSKGGEQKPIVNQFTMVPEQKETRVSETDGDGISYTLPTFLLNIKDDGEFTKYQDQLENNAKPFARFLSIKFTAVPGVVSGKEYNLTSPWCFPVNASGTMIARPSGTSGGEVPDWDYYGRTWKPEYEKKPAKKKAN